MPIGIIPKLSLIEEVLELLLTFIPEHRYHRCKVDVRFVHDPIGYSVFPGLPDVPLIWNDRVEESIGTWPPLQGCRTPIS